MLREDVVAAVKRKRFHVYAVDTIDEGVEILTGLPAGARGKDTLFAEGSVNARVENRLIAFAESRRKFGARDESKPGGKEA
jgi:predicted ATP-dependent protease